MSLTLGSIISSLDAHYGDSSRGAFTQSRMLEFVNSEVRMLRALFDLPTAEYVAQIPVYNGVYFYGLPAGFKDYVSLTQNYVAGDQTGFQRTDEKRFWALTGNQNWVAEERNGMQRTLLLAVNAPTMANVQLNALTDATGAGTWTAFGGASNVRTDTLFFRTGQSSVAFDLASTGGIYATDMPAIDLSGQTIDKIACMFLWAYLPNQVNFTNVIAQWGSDPSNCHTVTVTGRQGGSGFLAGWQQLGFDWTLAADTGTPVDSAVKFLKLTFTCPAGMAPQAGIRVNDAWMRGRALFNLSYTSDNLVTDASGNPTDEFAAFTNDTWTLNIPSEFKDFLVFRVLKRAYSFIKSNAMNIQQLDQNLQRLEDMLLARYPSRREPATQSYNDQETPTVYG